MKVHVITETDEIQRRNSVVQYLISQKAFQHPQNIVYLTLNRRKISELEQFFSEFLEGNFWLPQFRTLRGYFDDLFLMSHPNLFFINGVYKKILWKDLIRSLDLSNGERERLLSVLEDLFAFEHLTALYGISNEEKISFFNQFFPQIENGYRELRKAYSHKLTDISGVDYDEAPWLFHFNPEEQQEKRKPRFLVLDGFYWLYPYQSHILKKIINQFEEVIWVENPAVHMAQWKSPEERSIPETIASHLRQVQMEELISKIQKNFEKALTINYFSNVPTIDILKAPSISREVQNASRFLLYLFKQGNVAPEDITIVYSDPSYLPYIENTFQYVQIPYDIARGKKITQIPLFSNWIKLLMVKINDFPVEDSLYVLSQFFDEHSFVKFTSKEIRVLKEWFQFTDITFLGDLPKKENYSAWFKNIEKYAEVTEFLPASWVWDDKILPEIPDLLNGAFQKLRKWLDWYPSEENISFDRWIKWLEESFDIIYRQFSDREEQKKWIEQLDEMIKEMKRFDKRSGLGERSYGEWLNIFLELIGKFEFRETTGKGVHCLEKLENRDLTGKYLIVLGACKHFFPSEIRYPGFFKELLTSLLEKKHNFSTFSAFKESLYLLYDYTSNFTHVIFSFPTKIRDEFTGLSPVLLLEIAKALHNTKKINTLENLEEQIVNYLNEKAKSIYEAIESIPEFRAKIMTDELTDKLDMIVKHSALSARIDNKIDISSIYDGFLGVNEEWIQVLRSYFKSEDKISWSPSRLETLIQCPQKYWFRYWLGLTPEEKLYEGLDQRIMGRLFHMAMRFIFSDNEVLHHLKGNPDRVRTGEIFEQKFNEAFKIILNIFKDINSYFEFLIKGLEQRLKQQKYVSTFQKVELERMEDLPERLEQIVTEEEFNGVLNLTSNSRIPIKGRIDRVDIMNDKIYFYDYKYTSKANTYFNQMKEGLYWQLIIYYLLLEEKFPEKNIVGAVYPIKQINENKPIDFEKFNSFFENFSSTKEQIIKTLDELMTVYRQGHFYSSILDEDKVYCPQCPLREICNRKKNKIESVQNIKTIIPSPLKEVDLFPFVEGKKWIPPVL